MENRANAVSYRMAKSVFSKTPDAQHFSNFLKTRSSLEDQIIYEVDDDKQENGGNSQQNSMKKAPKMSHDDKYQTETNNVDIQLP